MTNVGSVTDIEQNSSSNGKSNLEAALPTLVGQSEPFQHYEDNSNVPRLSIFHIFWLFLTKFGIFAWGGPVAQIAIIKDYLVMQEEWITLHRFNRVFAVYQILPGPEAAELCMFFGCLAGGRIGGIAAGLGFILPGFLLTLLASYLYIVFGLGNIYVDASFRALQPMVAAMVGYCLYGYWCLISVIAYNRFFVPLIRSLSMLSCGTIARN